MQIANLKASVLILLVAAASTLSCKKEKMAVDTATPVIPPVTNNEVVPVNDPEIAKTIGFFSREWQAKSFIAPAYTETSIPASTTATVTIDASSIITKIPQSIFGHNAVWWMGPVPAAASANIKNLNPDIIRFPGGNASNQYFWNAEQGKLPSDVPDTYVDADGVSHPATYNYGKTDHNWELNLAAYYDLLQQTGSQGIISVNYSYARYSTAANPVASAAHLAADWVRYDNGRTLYWEVGNEHYGNWQVGYRIDKSKNKDGQPEIINGELYGNHAKVFVDSMRKAAAEINKTIYIGIVIHETPSPEAWQTQTTKTWNAGVMKAAGDKADFYVAHNYFTTSGNESAGAILSSATTVPASMMNFINQELQTNGAPIKPVALDEWNMFAGGSKQQVSNVSGLFALLVQGESIKNKYGMAARWDFVNGWENGNDHGLFSSGDEPGIAKWSPRPSFYYMYYFRKLLGDRLVPCTVEGSTELKSYASTYTSGEANVNIVNTSSTAESVLLKFKNFNAGNRYYWYTLEGASDNGEFSRKVLVNGSGPALDAGGPADYLSIKARSSGTANGLKVTVPARGAVFVVISKK